MARLLDSNILIYAAQPEHAFLDEWLEAPGTTLSAISITEVLGYEGITSDDEELFEAMFAQLIMQPVSETILRRAAGLRRVRKIKLGDAIIAATALERTGNWSRATSRTFAESKDYASSIPSRSEKL